jgi:hypothetical protein
MLGCMTGGVDVIPCKLHWRCKTAAAELLLALCDPDPGNGDAERLDGAGLAFVACRSFMTSEIELWPEFAILPLLPGADCPWFKCCTGCW